MRHLTLTILGLAMATAAAGCSSEDSGPAGSGGSTSGVTFTPSISECGGFPDNSGATALPPAGDPASYCDAEVLLWSYDAASRTLGLSNNRVVLNCCGDHSLSVARDGDTLVVTEKDAPEAQAGGARCGCSCVFDYAADVADVDAGMLKLRLERFVTDLDAAPVEVYEGEIDLGAGTGKVVIDAQSAEPWCDTGTPL